MTWTISFSGYARVEKVENLEIYSKTYSSVLLVVEFKTKVARPKYYCNVARQKNDRTAR